MYPKNNAPSIKFKGGKFTVHKNRHGKHLYVFDEYFQEWEICFQDHTAEDYGWSKKDIAFLKKKLGNFVTNVNW